MRTTQTPSELAASRRSNNPQKIFKKSLSSVVQESADLSPITQVVDENENEFGGNNELEIAVNLLKKARLQVLNSDSVNRRSKKLSDLLIETAVDNLPNDSKERDQTSELVNAKIAIVLLFLFFWILALVLYFRNLGGTSSFKGPLPT